MEPWNKNKMGWKKSKLKSKMIPCLECGIEVLRYPSMIQSRTFCTRSCRGIFAAKDKTHAIWNKGRKMSDEQKKFLSQANKNLVPPSRKGIKLTEEQKIKLRVGRKPWNYIGDRTQLAKKQERNDSAYKEWRKSVWLRDNFKCKIANPDCNGRIEAHHILSWHEYTELRYEINNGITLCHAHHPRKRAEEKRLSPYFMELVVSSGV